ncbi:hypothetical protein BCV69DRAFT_243906 [Microstroma glucosiphilum]|uniref:Uncharacterized protein n=1 Tax=Pseudomicrostroma glucosiphilum TaxID=1684307 RepID=A0A316UKA3_9BASI|nr:hypothetical protein BCV69DRAFT_243906 [Pseudomicrostroma glucosiphilum]PWN23655.1 hypothetical protein BCV69DRAFT_243906 [Pseudomicrostroma glucosiphilum]
MLALLADGNPALQARKAEIVFNPKILTPKQGDTWVHGEAKNVTWRTSDIPPPLKSANSTLYLGYLPKNSKSGNEHLKWKLANNFPLSAGTVSFIVPNNTVPRDDYIVVLLGDSGNRSERFEIELSEDEEKNGKIGTPKIREPTKTLDVVPLMMPTGRYKVIQWTA